MTKPEGVNLFNAPRNLASAAEATRRQRAREKREKNANLLGKEVIIRPESRAKGATVANARRMALEAMEDDEGTGVAETTQQSRGAPFSRCQEAFADLLAALHYPSGVTTLTGRVHHMSGEWEDAPEEQELRIKAVAPSYPGAEGDDD